MIATPVKVSFEGLTSQDTSRLLLMDAHGKRIAMLDKADEAMALATAFNDISEGLQSLLEALNIHFDMYPDDASEALVMAVEKASRVSSPQPA